MKIAVSSDSPSLDGNVEARFGRCPYFVVVNPNTMESQSIQNPNMALRGGVGPQTAQLMAQNGVAVVLTGNCGPNALRAFEVANIRVITGITGRVRDAVEKFKANQFKQASRVSPDIQNGMNGRLGLGRRGMGGGAGMGRGMGGGVCRPTPIGVARRAGSSFSPNLHRVASSSNDEEIVGLKETVKKLEEQLHALEGKVNVAGNDNQ